MRMRLNFVAIEIRQRPRFDGVARERAVKPITIGAVLNYPVGPGGDRRTDSAAGNVSPCVYPSGWTIAQNPSGIDGLAPAASAPVTSLPLSS